MNGPWPHVYPVDPFPEPFTMRSFDDARGQHWQAALIEASFGNVLMIFSRIGADGVRHVALETANVAEAEAMLAEIDDTRLRELLKQAKPWP